jgi:peptidyl-prolyl cis-trans isomerase C
MNQLSLALMNGAWFLRLIFSVSLLFLGAVPGRGEPEARILARVDGVPISASDVDRELGRLPDRLQGFSPDQAEAMRLQAERQALEDLIGKILLVNAARAEGLQVSDAEIDERLEVVMRSVAPGGTAGSFLKEAGISKDELAEDVRRNLLIQKLVERLTKDVVPPTAEQVEGFYEANKARFYREETVECRHIFFDLEGITDEAVIESKRRQAEALRAMLLENPGLDFGRISAERSEGPTAENGGYLGFMREGDFLPEFTKAAFAQEVGKVGQVVRTRLGFHLIKVESRSPARQPALAEIKDQVRDGMLQMKRAEIMRRKIDVWRRAAKIELLVPLETGDPAAPAPAPGTNATN